MPKCDLGYTHCEQSTCTALCNALQHYGRFRAEVERTLQDSEVDGDDIGGRRTWKRRFGSYDDIEDALKLLDEALEEELGPEDPNGRN